MSGDVESIEKLNMNKKLENRIARLEKAVKSNSKSTLEQRIARLENAVKSDRHQVRRKFESFESDLDVDSARAAANRIAQRFGRMMDANVRPDDLGDDVIDSPRYGWLSVDRTDEIMKYTIISVNQIKFISKIWML